MTEIDFTDPIAGVQSWLAEAEKGEPIYANAASLATCDAAGFPTVRVVLIRKIDAQGFTFYTNSTSRKGQDLAQNPNASLCFYWKSLDKQIRIDGPATPIDAAESDAYFAGRPRLSQLGAWASDQTSPLASRQLLDERVKHYEEKFTGKDVPRPDHWYGYRIAPKSIEFWIHGEGRLHDRFVYEKTGAEWNKQRLYP